MYVGTVFTLTTQGIIIVISLKGPKAKDVTLNLTI